MTWEDCKRFENHSRLDGCLNMADCEPQKRCYTNSHRLKQERALR